MREIKFRGLRTDGKGWVYGVPYYIAGERKCFIIDNCQSGDLTQEDSIFQGKEVEYKSIGQFTGLKDKNGKDIYEGDIIAISSRGFDFDCQVTYDKQLIPVGEKSKGWEHMLYSPYWEECVIIGNIHDQEK